MPAFPNLNADAGLGALNDHLQKRSYIEGYQVSFADIEVFSSISSKPDATKFPFASRWFSHISHLPAYIIAAIPKPASAPAAASSKAAAKDEDDIDLFGDEDEEDEEAHEAMLKQKAAEAAAKKKPKEAVIAKSSLLIDVKPWDDTTDMKALEESVRSIQMDGLIWGQSKLIPVAYGVKKLQINAVIVDDLVSTDDLEEKITAFEDYVQSMDIAAFNKI